MLLDPRILLFSLLFQFFNPLLTLFFQSSPSFLKKSQYADRHIPESVNKIQGSYQIYRLFQDLFQTFSGFFPDLTFPNDLLRSNTGTIT